MKHPPKNQQAFDFDAMEQAAPSEVAFEQAVPPKVVPIAVPCDCIKAQALPIEGASESQAPVVFTITEINQSVKDLLEGAYKDVWVSGEISGYKPRDNGFCYFTLKDEKSQLSAIIFPKDAKRLSFALQDGIEVMCHGKLSLYTASGKYQIVVDLCEPKGKGALQLAYEQLKKKLEAEGLFAVERKRKLPFLPDRIGVVTSLSGAAVKDIIKVVSTRCPVVSILIAPSRVQGAGAGLEIAKAINLIDQENIDLIIVGRGGGSSEDLWAFNEEVVARAIFAAKHPVISAVGHAIDISISDLVADHHAPTPSAAAEKAVPDMKDLLRRIDVNKGRLAFGLKKWVSLREERLIQLKKRLGDPRKKIHDLISDVFDQSVRLKRAMDVFLSMQVNRYERLKDILQGMSPFAVLDRGYAIVTRLEHVISNSSDLKVKDDVSIQFGKGRAKAAITGVD